MSLHLKFNVILVWFEKQFDNSFTPVARILLLFKFKSN